MFLVTYQHISIWLVLVGARVWLLMGFLLLFGGLIAASWILFGAYVVPGTTVIIIMTGYCLNYILIIITVLSLFSTETVITSGNVGQCLAWVWLYISSNIFKMRNMLISQSHKLLQKNFWALPTGQTDTPVGRSTTELQEIRGKCHITTCWFKCDK